MAELSRPHPASGPYRTRGLLLPSAILVLLMLPALGFAVGPNPFSSDRPVGLPFAPAISYSASPGVDASRAGTAAATPLHLSLTVNRTSTPENSPVTFAGLVTPGTGGPFTLAWGGSLPSGCSSGPTSSSTGTISYTCSPSQTGPFNVQVTASNLTGSVSNSTSLTVYQDLAVTFTLSPGMLSAQTQLSVNLQITGGVAPYTLSWTGLPSPCSGNAPNSESNAGSAQFQCDPTQTGTTQVGLQVSDSGAPNHATSSYQQSVQVTSSNNNNNNNGNGSNHNNNGNGSSNFSIPGLSNLGSLLSVFLIGALIVFALLVVTAVSTLATAILVARRLPPRNRGTVAAETQPCPSCGKLVPAGSKFCLECGKPMGTEKGSPPG